MSEKINKTISSLMDGEWGDLDPSRCVAEIAASAEQRATWARYHLARDAMRGESLQGSMSVAAAVSAALVDEPAYTNVTDIGARNGESATGSTAVEAYEQATVETLKPRTKSASGGLRWGLGAAGFGIAASAALATFIGLNYWNNTYSAVDPSALVAQITASGSSATSGGVQVGLDFQAQQAPVDLVAHRGSFWVSGSGQRSAAEERFNMLLSDHIEHSPASDWSGMLPYSRLVGYDSSEPTQ